jgi:hypothetical protein
MSYVGPLVAAAAGLLVSGAAYLEWKERRRYRGYTAYCRERHYAYTKRSDGEERKHKATCPVFEVGDRRVWEHTIRGSSNGVPFTAFEYTWYTGSGKGSSVDRIGAVLWTVEQALPRFMMTSNHFWHTTGTFYRGEVIRFDESPEFSRHFRLRGDDAAKVRALFTGDIRQALEVDPRHRVAGYRQELMWWRDGSLPSPNAFDQFLMEGDRVRALFLRS